MKLRVVVNSKGKILTTSTANNLAAQQPRSKLCSLNVILTQLYSSLCQNMSGDPTISSITHIDINNKLTDLLMHTQITESNLKVEHSPIAEPRDRILTGT